MILKRDQNVNPFAERSRFACICTYIAAGTPDVDILEASRLVLAGSRGKRLAASHLRSVIILDFLEKDDGLEEQF